MKDETVLFTDRDLRRLLIPLMLEQLLSGFMGIADTMMVTRAGDTAISAVSCVDSINSLMLYIFAAFATGGCIVCSQYLGRKDVAGARHAMEQVYFTVTAISVGFCLLCVLFRRPILHLVFGTVEQSIMDQSLQYFFITAFSYPFLALQQTAAAQFRSTGNSRTPMIVSAWANVLNVVGNAILIFGLGLGVVGAAVATLAGRVFSCVILMNRQRRRGGEVSVEHYLAIRPQVDIIRLVLRIAIPTAFEQGMFQFGKLAVQSTVSTLGTTAIAAQAMIAMLECFQSMAGQAVGLGLMTVAGHCLGAGRPDEARRYTRKLLVYAEAVIIASCVLILIIMKPACVLSGLSEEASALTIHLLIIITFAKVTLWALAFVLPNCLRAAGDNTFTAAVAAASMWTMRVGGSLLLCRVLGVGLIGVWIAWFADWVVRLTLYIWRYRSGRWERKRVLD